MLSYSGITVLSFANKVVKVQPQKFVRSLYGVPRTLQYIVPSGQIELLHYQHQKQLRPIRWQHRLSASPIV